LRKSLLRQLLSVVAVLRKLRCKGRNLPLMSLPSAEGARQLTNLNQRRLKLRRLQSSSLLLDAVAVVRLVLLRKRKLRSDPSPSPNAEAVRLLLKLRKRLLKRLLSVEVVLQLLSPKIPKLTSWLLNLPNARDVAQLKRRRIQPLSAEAALQSQSRPPNQHLPQLKDPVLARGRNVDGQPLVIQKIPHPQRRSSVEDLQLKNPLDDRRAQSTSLRLRSRRSRPMLQRRMPELHQPREPKKMLQL